LHNANQERSRGESRAGEKREVSLIGIVIDVTRADVTMRNGAV
jgi:hypothetical protein